MVYDGTATVVTPGTKVPLTSVPTKADWVTVFTGTAAGNLYVGGATVDASAGRGAPLTTGSANVFWPFGNSHGAYDLSQIFIDSTSASDSVSFIYGRN